MKYCSIGLDTEMVWNNQGGGGASARLSEINLSLAEAQLPLPHY